MVDMRRDIAEFKQHVRSLGAETEKIEIAAEATKAAMQLEEMRRRDIADLTQPMASLRADADKTKAAEAGRTDEKAGQAMKAVEEFAEMRRWDFGNLTQQVASLRADADKANVAEAGKTDEKAAASVKAAEQLAERRRRDIAELTQQRRPSDESGYGARGAAPHGCPCPLAFGELGGGSSQGQARQPASASLARKRGRRPHR